MAKIAPLGQIEIWRRENMALLRSYGGQAVAIHPTMGIVAADKDVRKVIQKVLELNLTTEVVIESIPKASK